MYQVDVVTLFPEMFSAVLNHGVIGRALKTNKIQFRSWNPRHFTEDKHHTVDDRPYGGGPGMVMLYEPLCAAIDQARRAQPESKVIYLSPQGQVLNQAAINRFSAEQGLILVAGRYEGIDKRVLDTHIDEEWSIGDYVLSGGEIPAMVMIDSICRTIPGVLGHEESAQQDSFVDGLLDYPHYTRPEQINGMSVPAVLLSGDHDSIRKWRLKQALGETWKRRPDLLDIAELDEEKSSLLEEFIAEQKQ